MVKEKIFQTLIQFDLLSEEQAEKAELYMNKNNTRPIPAITNLGVIKEDDLTSFLSEQFGIPLVSLDHVQIEPKLVRLVPRQLCEKHGLIPVEIKHGKVTVAISDPTNVSAIDDLKFLLNLDVDIVLGGYNAIYNLIQQSFASEITKIFDEIEGAQGFGKNKRKKGKKEELLNISTGIETHDLDHSQKAGVDTSKPVLKLIDTIFLEAIRRKASDIHIEPLVNGSSRVRFRIDGSLIEILKITPELRSPTAARIKVLASLDISEKRLPQDGRIPLKISDRKVDVRVSILPTIFGEKVVMRILDQGTKIGDLSTVGFEEDQLLLFKNAIAQPYGMILVTGPTGSGKSTTLYAVLSELNKEDVNISTAEDPVEYNMMGVNQVQTNDSIGLTFAHVLRSLLRQDPDIVMVGEIRDQETAEISIKAALTGHLVFSTLHTNDAPSTITRLIHMGVEPFLITASLNLIQAQRLVRAICEKCKDVDSKITEQELIQAEVPKEWIGEFSPMRGHGCNYCNHTGYQGRSGIFEVMTITEKLRSLIIAGASVDKLKEAAISEGLITLRQHAIIKLFRGETTLEEVLNNSRPDKDWRMHV